MIKISNYSRGFTLIELIVAIAITAVLSGIILFSVNQYINKGKDSNIAGNLVVLTPAGEVYYNGNNNSYQDFCQSSIVDYAFSQIPSGTAHHCGEDATGGYQSWAACVRKFTNPDSAYCVDSRGVKKEISNNLCTAAIVSCP